MAEMLKRSYRGPIIETSFAGDEGFSLAVDEGTGDLVVLNVVRDIPYVSTIYNDGDGCEKWHTWTVTNA